MFSKKFTWVNMAVSVVGYVCWLVWYYHRFDPTSPNHPPFYILVVSTLLPFLLSAALTLTLLCIPREIVSVYDPSSDKRFIIESGEVVEPNEEDEV